MSDNNSSGCLSAIGLLIIVFIVIPIILYFAQVALIFAICPILTLWGYHAFSAYRKDSESGTWLLIGGIVSLALAFGAGILIDKMNETFETRHPFLVRPWYFWLIVLGTSHLAGLMFLWLLNSVYGLRQKNRVSHSRLSEEAERAKVRAENQRREDARRTNERREQDEQKQRQKKEQNNNRQDRDFKETLSEKQALELFEMKKPYTLDELKKRRMDLLKKVHPDQGGSNMMARLVNDAFEVLKTRI